MTEKDYQKIIPPENIEKFFLSESFGIIGIINFIVLACFLMAKTRVDNYLSLMTYAISCCLLFIFGLIFCVIGFSKREFIKGKFYIDIEYIRENKIFVKNREGETVWIDGPIEFSYESGSKDQLALSGRFAKPKIGLILAEEKTNLTQSPLQNPTPPSGDLRKIAGSLDLT